MENYLDALLNGPIPRERSFPPAEYAARIERARAAMDAAGIDVWLIHAVVDICYLTGYQTLWPDAYACLVLPADGEPFMQLGEIEASCAALHGDIEDLVLLDWVGAASAPRQLADLLQSRGLGSRRIAVQMGRLELGNRGPVDAVLMDQLRAALPDARFVDASLLGFELRVTKSPAEIAHLRRAAEITGKAMKAAIEAVEVGKTENDIAALAAETMIAEGSEFFSIDPIVNAGHRTGYFHTTFKRTPIRPGDHVQLELGACWHRYTAPLMRTLVMGTPDDQVRRVIDANLAALDLLYANVRPGRTSHDVAVAVRNGLSPVERDLFRSGHFGYSVGLGFPPTWADGPLYIAEGLERELVSGMCFHTPFSWRVPKVYVIGTSETILVSETGCEILTDVPRRVPLKP